MKQLRRAVVEHVGLHRRGASRCRRRSSRWCGKQLASVHAALAVLGELALRAEQLGVALDEREPLALDERLGHRLAVELAAASGLGSNSSSWLGPPAMNRKMTLFAFGGKCGGFGRERVGASAARRRRPAPAATPGPSRRRRRRSRGRSAGGCWCRAGRSVVIASLPRDELVQVQQHARHARPRGALAGVDALGRRVRRPARCASSASAANSLAAGQAARSSRASSSASAARGQAEAERVPQPAVVVRRRLAEHARGQRLRRTRRTPGR